MNAGLKGLISKLIADAEFMKDASGIMTCKNVLKKTERIYTQDGYKKPNSADWFNEKGKYFTQGNTGRGMGSGRAR